MSRAAVRRFDAAVDRWVDRHRGPRLDPLFYGLSSAADHSLLWHGIGVVRAAVCRDPRAAARFSAAMGIESALTNGLIKAAFRRIRPDESPTHTGDGPLPYGLHRPITSSFPSGHATAAFTAATLLSHGRRTAPAWFALAGLVAASRVYVRMHHASDVLAGAALGVLLGRALAPVARQSGR